LVLLRIKLLLIIVQKEIKLCEIFLFCPQYFINQTFTNINYTMEEGYRLEYTSLSGGTIKVHFSHQKHELPENLFFGKILADKGKHIKLLPYTKIQGAKNPDAEADGRVLEFKFPSSTQNPHSIIQSYIEVANKQGAEIVKFYIANPNITIRDLKRALIGSLNEDWNKNIQEIWLLYEDEVLVEITRKEVENKSFIQKLRS
jgi:hypothetical protein